MTLQSLAAMTVTPGIGSGSAVAFLTFSGPPLNPQMILQPQVGILPAIVSLPYEGAVQLRAVVAQMVCGRKEKFVVCFQNWGSEGVRASEVALR